VSRLAAIRRGRSLGAKISGGRVVPGENFFVSTKLDTFCYLIVQTAPCHMPSDVREKYFTVSSLADLFNRVDNHTVIDFIKETHFYHQL